MMIESPRKFFWPVSYSSELALFFPRSMFFLFRSHDDYNKDGGMLPVLLTALLVAIQLCYYRTCSYTSTLDIARIIWPSIPVPKAQA